jgi:hypothetical protein
VPSPSPVPSAVPTRSATPAATPSPSPVPSPSGTIAFNDWSTYQYDAARDGFNPNTTAITPASIANLHVAWQVAVGEGADFQPLIATNVAGHTALVIVAGYQTIHAYDAQTGAVVWKDELLGQNIQDCGTSGITGTAAYDAALGAIFVAAGNGSTMSPSHVLLYELYAATGAVMTSVDVTPNLVTGEATSGHTAVTLANGMLYLGTGSNCEGTTTGLPSWLGRIVAVNPNTMAIANTFYTTYGQGGNTYGGGGVWAWGGVSADANGNVYAGSGNAETADTIKQTPPPPVVIAPNENSGYAEQLVKLTSNLSTVEDSNAPTFNFSFGQIDLDYPGTPTLFQPPINSGCSDLLSATMGKGGLLVVNDTTNLNPPVNQYQLSIPTGNAYYIGNPGYSPNLGYLYGAINSSGRGGAMLPPGLAAIGNCGSSIVWNAQFGPDSSAFGHGDNPRSAPTVTSGGVVFIGTACTANSSGGCGTPTSTVNGALWAVDASAGTVLNGGNPLLTTADDIRMAPSADAKWLWVTDKSGNLYGMTVDPTVPAVAKRRGTYHAQHYHFISD